MRYLLPIAVFVIGPPLMGCGLPDRHAARKITTAEVVGTWQMTTASRQLLKRDGYAELPGQTYTITFNPEGTVKFASVLDHFKGGTNIECGGRWNLYHEKTIGNEIVRANALDLHLNRADGPYTRTLSFAEEGGKLRLWSFYGDPDSWEFIEYERQ
jgi:hypothetical protein